MHNLAFTLEFWLRTMKKWRFITFSCDTFLYLSQGFAIFPGINIVAICTWIPSIKANRLSNFPPHRRCIMHKAATRILNYHPRLLPNINAWRREVENGQAGWRYLFLRPPAPGVIWANWRRTSRVLCSRVFTQALFRRCRHPSELFSRKWASWMFARPLRLWKRAIFAHSFNSKIIALAPMKRIETWHEQMRPAFAYILSPTPERGLSALPAWATWWSCKSPYNSFIICDQFFFFFCMAFAVLYSTLQGLPLLYSGKAN